jgi:hypothetical protein
VAESVGREGIDKAALSSLLARVGGLPRPPDAQELAPLAHAIGTPRLIAALDTPGRGRLGAARLLIALRLGDRPLR